MTTLLSGCGASPSQVLSLPGGAQAVVDGDSSDSMEALVEGQVRLGPGKCLSLDSGGEELFVIIWPEGTESTSEEAPEVRVPGRVTVGVGDTITGVGGTVPPDLVENVDVEAVCGSAGIRVTFIQAIEVSSG